MIALLHYSAGADLSQRLSVDVDTQDAINQQEQFIRFFPLLRQVLSGGESPNPRLGAGAHYPYGKLAFERGLHFRHERK